MQIDVFTANLGSAKVARSEFQEWLGKFQTAPDFVALHQSVTTLDVGLVEAVTETTAVHGATSCLGVMGSNGPKIENGAGAFAIWDESGDYGTALAEIKSDPRKAAAEATVQALLAADRSGEAPDLIWISASPGSEEQILLGVEDVVGGNVPILGGSAADNSISGEWRVFNRHSMLANGVIVSVLFPSTSISFAYHNGYAPTSHTGTVTKADGRALMEIDNRPAAEVYREWVGPDAMPSHVTETTAILSESTLKPLGQYLESVGDVPYYLLAHPAGLTPDGALELFADVKAGDRLTLMSGAPDQLTQRAGKVVALAAQSGNLQPAKVAGALMVYCGGCMLAVQDRLTDVTDGVSTALPGVPYLGIFTFGEQGVVLDGHNRHGNLMISAIIFGA